MLIHMGHYARTWGSDAYLHDFPGLSVEAARWLGSKGIVSFGVEAVSPGTEGETNYRVHLVCKEMGFTHMEGLVNLDQVIGKGRFRFCGFPLKIKGGTASPPYAPLRFLTTPSKTLLLSTNGSAMDFEGSRTSRGRHGHWNERAGTWTLYGGTTARDLDPDDTYVLMMQASR